MKERTEEHKEWLAHERTKRLRGEVSKLRETLLKRLLQICEESTDVKIVRLITEYRQANRAYAMLQNGDEYGGTSGPLPDVSPQGSDV